MQTDKKFLQPTKNPVDPHLSARVQTPPTADCIVPTFDGEQLDLDAPELYLNRELTWLNFNWRVFQEAKDSRNPLLERWRFLTIVASNLDEFIMKRIGGLMLQHEAGVNALTIDGRTPLQQIFECNLEIDRMREEWRTLFRELNNNLDDHGIRLASYSNLEPHQQKWLRNYYLKSIFPLVTPQATGPAHSFPFISNLSINLLVTVENRGRHSVIRIKAPISAEVPAIIQVGDANTFVPLEDIMANTLDLLFPGSTVVGCDLFRVIRNANTERDEESPDDLLAMIESEIRDRQFAPVVHLEINHTMPPHLRRRLSDELNLVDSSNVIEVESPLFRRDFYRLTDCYAPQLKFPKHDPAEPPFAQHSMIQTIRERGALLVHHPYESFKKSVLKFLREAAEDPKVRAIKMALYRTDRESKIIKYLTLAARNGKQVAVAVELKARFDEQANIEWARFLEEQGIHVTYGVVGLKTHCKCILVVRWDEDGLRRYVHFGTGNYHSETADLYSDVGLFTCDNELGEDATQLFNYLTTGIAARRTYSKLLTSPERAKEGLILKIKREISLHTQTKPGLIEIKTNALEDADLTRVLYMASQAGVQVRLLVRDTCRIRPGIPGLSENIHVVSILGRFLEHARIYHFGADGEDEYYIGSADAMKRNLESRVETLVPVEDLYLKSQLQQILDLQLGDRRSAWVMQSDGSYIQLTPDPLHKSTALTCQQRLIDVAQMRTSTGY